MPKEEPEYDYNGMVERHSRPYLGVYLYNAFLSDLKALMEASEQK